MQKINVKMIKELSVICLCVKGKKKKRFMGSATNLSVISTEQPFSNTTKCGIIKDRNYEGRQTMTQRF